MTDEPDSVDQLISRYLDGEATDDEISRVESDPALAARAESMRAAIEAVAAPVAIPTDALDRIRAAAIAESATTEQVTDLAAAAARRSAERRNRLLAAAAAFVFLAVGVVAIRSLPDTGDDDTAGDTAEASTDDSGDDATDTGSDDSGFSTFGTEESERDGDDDMAEEEAEADMAEETTADDDMAEEDGDDMADEEEPAAAEAPADETQADDAASPATRMDLLPDELPPPPDRDALVESIIVEYEGRFDAENAVGLTEDELFAELCPAAAELASGSLTSPIASIEVAATELDGVLVTVIVVAGVDGTLGVLTHPLDDCDAVEVLAVVEPS